MLPKPGCRERHLFGNAVDRQHRGLLDADCPVDHRVSCLAGGDGEAGLLDRERTDGKGNDEEFDCPDRESLANDGGGFDDGGYFLCHNDSLLLCAREEEPFFFSLYL